MELGNRSADRLVVECYERAAPERLLVDIDALDDRRERARRDELLPWRKDRERGWSRPRLPHPILIDAHFSAQQGDLEPVLVEPYPENGAERAHLSSGDADRNRPVGRVPANKTGPHPPPP